ncbi:MAG: hypothetical protein ACK48E_01810 [Holosporales bacterium]|jgi:hypothetical protein
MAKSLEISLSGDSEGNTKPLWDALCQEKFIPFAEAHNILFPRLEALMKNLTTKKGYQALSSSYQGTDSLPERDKLARFFAAVTTPMNILFDYYQALHGVNTNWSLRAANALKDGQERLSEHRRYDEKGTHISDAELAGRCFHNFLESFTKLYDILNAISPAYMKDIVGNAEQSTSALVGVLETHQLQQMLPAGRYAQSAQGLIDGHESIEIWRENKRSLESISEEIKDASSRLFQSALTVEKAEESGYLNDLKIALEVISELTQNGNHVEELDQQRSFVYTLVELSNAIHNIHIVDDYRENYELFKQADRLLQNLWENFVFPADIEPANRVWIAEHFVDNTFDLYRDLSKTELDSNGLLKLYKFLKENPVVHNPQHDIYLQSLPGQLKTIVEQVETKCIDIPEWAGRETTRVTEYTIFAVAEWLESLGIETASWYRPKRPQLGTEDTLPEKFLNVENVSAVLDVSPVSAEPAETGLTSTRSEEKSVPEPRIDPQETYTQRIIREFWANKATEK